MCRCSIFTTLSESVKDEAVGSNDDNVTKGLAISLINAHLKHCGKCTVA